MNALKNYSAKDAIHWVLEHEGFALIEYPLGRLRPIPDYVEIQGPTFSRDVLAALLESIDENEWENWVFWLFSNERRTLGVVQEAAYATH